MLFRLRGYQLVWFGLWGNAIGCIISYAVILNSYFNIPVTASIIARQYLTAMLILLPLFFWLVHKTLRMKFPDESDLGAIEERQEVLSYRVLLHACGVSDLQRTHFKSLKFEAILASLCFSVTPLVGMIFWVLSKTRSE